MYLLFLRLHYNSHRVELYTPVSVYIWGNYYKRYKYFLKNYNWGWGWNEINYKTLKKRHIRICKNIKGDINKVAYNAIMSTFMCNNKRLLVLL